MRPTNTMTSDAQRYSSILPRHTGSNPGQLLVAFFRIIAVTHASFLAVVGDDALVEKAAVPDGLAVGCTIPEQWLGPWFEGGVGDVRITPNGIDNKGICVERFNDYFLFDNREIGCFTCIQITQRHDNVLQYKESVCYGQEARDRVCRTIHPETVPRTLIREPSGDQSCPFLGAYHFIYNNNSGGECRSPTSYSSSCASDAHLRLRFRHCTDAAYTYERDVDVHCLAAWRDASFNYAIWRLDGAGFEGRDGEYRCLVYQVRGNVIHVAMSADASCRGVISPTDGPVRIEFTEDIFGWQPSHCAFPEWLSRDTWRDLAGSHVFAVDDSGDTLRQLTDRRRPETVLRSFRCLHGRHSNATTDRPATFTAITVVRELCSSRYQCLKIVRRGEGIVQITEGSSRGHHHNDRCAENDANETSLLLISENSANNNNDNNNNGDINTDDAMARCPFSGRYSIYTGSSNCQSFFRSACSSPNIVDIVSACSSRPGLELECLRSWTEGQDERQFFIATLATNGSSLLANCFSIRLKGDSLLLSVDAECNVGVAHLLRDRITYTMTNKLLPCDAPTVVKFIGNVSSSSSSSDGRRHDPPPPPVKERVSESSKLTDSSRQSRERKANWQHSLSAVDAATSSSSSTTSRRSRVFLRHLSSTVWPVFPAVIAALFWSSESRIVR